MSIIDNLRRGHRFLTDEDEATLPPYILLTTNSPGFDACQAVLEAAEAAGVHIRCEDGRPLSISRLDDLEALDEPVALPFEPYSDEDAAKEVEALGFHIILLPDFLENSDDDDGTRCGDGSIPARWYVVEALDTKVN